MTINYNADAMSGKWDQLLPLLLRLENTVFTAVFSGPMFWLVNGFHWFCIGVDRYQVWHDDDQVDDGTPFVDMFFNIRFAEAHGYLFDKGFVDWKAATVGLSLTVFFLVFYNNNTYVRFFQLYGHTVGLGGGIMEWTSIVKSNCIDDKSAQWNAVRFMLAAMHVLYYQLHTEEAGIPEARWQLIQERHLLAAEEVKTLKAFAGPKWFLTIYWALEEAKGQLKVLESEKDPPRGSPTMSPRSREAKADASLAPAIRQGLLVQQLREAAFGFRGHCGQIVSMLKQPVPFPYFHLLNVMLFINLSFISYAIVGLAFWPFTVVIMGLASSILIGMRSLAVQLSDPFGNDEVDFEVEEFLTSAYANAVAHLKAPCHQPCLRKLPGGLTSPLYGPGEQPDQDGEPDENPASVDEKPGGADEMAERLLPHASRLPPPTLPTKERSLESVWSSMGLVGKDDASKGGSSDLL